jgi:hypothetical protein
MAFTYRVLCFGHNLMLLETRQWIPEKRFPSVYVSSLSDLERLAEGGGFDLLILCHSLSRHDLRKAADLVHDICPRLKILALSSDITAWDLPVSDQVVVGLEGPRAQLPRDERPLYLN